MRKILTQKFFNRDTKTIAQELLGKYLVRKIGDREVSVMITETEAYDGLQDKASHASKGKTARTEIMFGEAGYWYVYLCYGMYYMLNIVTREVGYPAAILIRGGVCHSEQREESRCCQQKATGFFGSPAGGCPQNDKLDGPGKLTKFLQIDKSFNCKKADKISGLWFEDRGISIQEKNIQKTPRIGVAYAGSVWSKKKMRFVLKNL